MPTQRTLPAVALSAALILTACAATPAAMEESTPQPTMPLDTPSAKPPTTAPTLPLTPALPTSTEAPTITPTEAPPSWQDWPVIPTISQTTLDIYRRGLAIGRDPRSFAVLGECESELEWYVGEMRIDGYLAGFDNPARYRLGPDYAYLQETIDNFLPSFSRPRVAAKRGMNAASVLSPLHSDPDLCDVRESPLECEIRRSNPTILFISMETWFYDRPITTYETYVRQIVEYAIEQGVVPVLVTAADNHEHSRDLNAALAKLAYEYDIPLWNFWQAVQALPGGGVEPLPDENGFRHLTYAPNYFDQPLTAAWPVRNLTGLQVLDAIWRAGMGLPPATP